MDIFLQTLGLFFLGLVVFLILTGLRLFWLLRRARYAPLAQPSELHLEALQAVDSAQHPSSPSATELRAQGFQAGSLYESPEFPGMRIWPFFSDQGYLAVLYLHPLAGEWVDLYLNYRDGGSLTFSNAPVPQTLEGPEDQVKKVIKEASVPELLAAIEKERDPERTWTPIDASNFVAVFEAAYGRERKWFNQRGGLSFTEFKKLAGERGAQVSEDKLRQVYRQIKQAEILQWESECLQAFQQETEMKVHEFLKYSVGMFVVSDLFDAAIFVQYLQNHLSLNSDQQNSLLIHAATKSLTATLRMLRPRLEQELDLEIACLGEVLHPIHAQIYGIAPSPKD